MQKVATVTDAALVGKEIDLYISPAMTPAGWVNVDAGRVPAGIQCVKHARTRRKGGID